MPGLAFTFLLDQKSKQKNQERLNRVQHLCLLKLIVPNLILYRFSICGPTKSLKPAHFAAEGKLEYYYILPCR